MAAIDEEVEDWSQTAASNTPAGADAVSTDLANNAFRDVKKAIRLESLRKGWEVDGHAVTSVSATEFEIAGTGLLDQYCPGQAFRITRSAGNDIGGYIESITEPGGNTRFKVNEVHESDGTAATIGGTVSKVYFSVHRPRGTPDNIIDNSFPNTPPPYPPLLQHTLLYVPGNVRVAHGRWAYPMPDTGYYCVAQVVSQSNVSGFFPEGGSGNADGLYAFEVESIVKTSTTVTLTLAEEWTGNAADSIFWQLTALYQIGGQFV
jgi:hypothetical protein